MGMESTPRSDTGCLGGTTGVDPVERVLGGSTAAGPVAVVAAFQSWLRDLDTSMLPDPVRVDLLTALERVKGSTAAAQARLTVDFADSQTRSFERDAAEIAADPSRQTEALGSGLLSSRGRARAASRSVGSQVGLARRCSPAVADRLVAAARQLVGQLPHTLAC